MRTDRAFTLVEVLLAVVLLAAVVGVCAPFLAGRAALDPGRSQSEFVALADQLIAQQQIAHANGLTFKDYAQIAATRGWRCQRIPIKADQETKNELYGEWIELSDGVHARLCWAAIDPGEKMKP